MALLICLGITGTCVHDNFCHWNVHENSCRWVYPAPRKLPQKSVEHHGLHCCCFRVSTQNTRENIYTHTSLMIIINLVLRNSIYFVFFFWKDDWSNILNRIDGGIKYNLFSLFCRKASDRQWFCRTWQNSISSLGVRTTWKMTRDK